MAPGDSGSNDRAPRPDSSKLRVYHALKRDIVRGAVKMGQRLNENQLAARFEVSKTPVREALVLLQQEELVEVLPRVGYRISRVTVQDVDDIFNLRRIVEAAAADIAATAMTDDSLHHLAHLQSRYEAGDRETYPLFLEENLEFHRTIAEASGNRRLVEVVVRLLEQMHRLIVLKLDLSSSREDLVEQHGQILAALRRHDPQQARAAMLSDIANTHQVVRHAISRLVATWHI